MIPRLWDFVKLLLWRNPNRNFTEPKMAAGTDGSQLWLLCAMVLATVLATLVAGNDDAKRLYHDLLIQNKYNKLIRPVGNDTNRPLTVKMGIRLSQIIDVVCNGYSINKLSYLYLFILYYLYVITRLWLTKDPHWHIFGRNGSKSFYMSGIINLLNCITIYRRVCNKYAFYLTF